MMAWAPPSYKNTQRWLGVLLLGLLFGLTGCSTPKESQKWLQLDNSLQVFELVDVPFFANQDYYCGPAALASMMSYHGRPTTPDRLINQLIIPDKQGTLQIELAAVVRQSGWVPYAIKGTLVSLEQAILAGYPVLVLQNLGLDWVPRWHYALVVGFNRREGYWVLRSDDQPRRITSTSLFERTWARADYWGIVLAEPNQPPNFAEARPWFQHAFDLESVNKKEAAQQVYTSGYLRWPEVLSFGLAKLNYYYEQQAWSAGDQLLAQLWPAHQSSALLWNNWAVWLASQGCQDLAKQALQCGFQQDNEASFLQQTASKLGIVAPSQDPSLASPECKILKCLR